MTSAIKIFFIFSLLLLGNSCTRPPLPAPIVLFDQAHDNVSQVSDHSSTGLSILANHLKKHGFDVRSSDSPLSSKLLTDVSTVFIPSPARSISIQEIKVLKQFIAEGGQLCVLVGNSEPLAKLLAGLNVAISNGLIRDTPDNKSNGAATDFIVSNIAPHPLTNNLSALQVHGSYALKTRLAANAIARTNSTSWVDLNNNLVLEPGDAKQSFTIIATGQLGHGLFIIFADTNMLTNSAMSSPNLILVQNLAQWLKEGTYAVAR